MSGPPPQPDAVKRLRGNPGKRKLASDKEVPVVAQPVGHAKPSNKLRPAARHVWNTLAPELQRLNLLRGTDSNALSRYCDDLAAYWDVSEKLRVKGLTYEVNSNHGTYQRLNPLFTVQERLAARLIVIEDRFGLSPQSRQALMVRAAQLAASQGNLPFGGAAQPDPLPSPDGSPVGFFGDATTKH